VTQDFSSEQKRWLEGFVSGTAATRALRQQPAAATAGTAGPPNAGPDAALWDAQERAARGGKLTDQEKWKRTAHPMDSYARLKQVAQDGEGPKPDDNFRWRYHGLFYAAPTQTSFMCRLRVPNGILTHWQMRAVADIAAEKGGGYAHVTTRANLQIREIAPKNGPDVVEALAAAGIIVKGAGADNIRNVTGSATAGIDPSELLDTRPQARAFHHHILNDRSLYGLPRKFNVAFDGGGAVATLEDTNDIGFQAVEVMPGGEVAPGIWYRLALGGITGHKDLARDTGIVVEPDKAIAVADAVLRVFIENGDRTDRTKARLKYVLDAWGFDKYLGAVEEKLGCKLARVSAGFVKPRPAHDRLAHLGVHKQKQPGQNWIGVWTPLGRMTSAQMHALADVARDCGDGDIRLTVWQNLLISGVPDAAVEDAKAKIAAADLAIDVSNIRTGLVACTGNMGCKFAASDTKGHALAIADHLDARLQVDQPINIHLTGCHHSCAQHYIGDIGLLAAKVTINDDGDQVEGYHIHAGGGFGAQGAIARLVYSDVKADDAPMRIEGLLRAYLVHRASPQETFHAFSARHDIETLQRLASGAAQ
jgi:ferredoxin-nitrite reductase